MKFKQYENGSCDIEFSKKEVNRKFLNNQP